MSQTEEKRSQEPVSEAKAEQMPSENPQNKQTKKEDTPFTPVVIKSGSGRVAAAGALVLALLSLGASGFLFVQGQNVLKNQELAFAQKIDKAALGESENAAMLRDSLNRQNLIRTELERLNADQKNTHEQTVLTRKAYQELLKGRVDWLADEAETMLNLASQQLLLSGNVQGAIGVLEHISNRLNRFEQAELLPLKQAISSDLAELKNRPYIDVSGTSLRIDRLETAVAGLPLLVDGTLKPTAVQALADNPNLSWWENAWQKSLNALKGLVEVRHLESNDAMLLSPEQSYFIRENLRLRLLNARTALMQHNVEVYQSNLNNIETTVKQYFDGKSPATQSWLKELAELKTLDVRIISEDVLKNSLAAVRAYQENTVLQENLQNAAIANEIEAKAASEAMSETASGVVPNVQASEPVVNMPELPKLPSEQQAEQPKQPTKPAPTAKSKGEPA